MPDNDLDFLRPLDPALTDEPPAPGSPRYTAIRAKVRPRRRWVPWASAGTAAAASVLVTVLVLGGGGTSAEATVRAAADRTEQVTTLRGTVHDQIRTGGGSNTTVESNGADRKIVTDYGDSIVTLTIVDGIGYETNTDGRSSKTELPPEFLAAPFADAAGNVVRAALTGSEVEEKGTEEVRGVEARRFRVTMTPASRAALAALPVNETMQFGVEQAGDVPELEITALEIWTADDLIRRITVEMPERVFTTEFYDFGAPVTISVPPGF